MSIGSDEQIRHPDAGKAATFEPVMLREASAPHATPPVYDIRGKAIDLSPLRTLLARIAAKYHPEQVWLFGSRARGEAREFSDWDILVVVPDHIDETDLDEVTTWELQRGSGVHADVIACHISEFMLARDTVNTLAYEAVHAGVQIDER